MLLSRLVVGTCCAAAWVLGTDFVSGQPYPNKAVRLVTGTPASSTDIASRLIADGLTVSLGQPVIVENRGGGGPVAGPRVANAAPDGYSIFLYGSTLWLTPLLQPDASYDPIRDFAPITLALSSPSVLVVHPSVAANSTKELIALAKAAPGQLNYGSTGSGSVSHLTMELFKAMAGVNIVRVNYAGTAQATNDLLSGAVHVMFTTTTAAAPHFKSARLRALAVSSAQPSALLPGLPTVAASGLPGFEASSTLGIVAPAKTPAPIIKRLNHEIVRVLVRPEAKERFFNMGIEVVASSPQQFQATIKSDMARLGKVIKDAGIRGE